MQLSYKKYGEIGEPIIILHGLFGMSDNWHIMARRLSETNTVYALDLRNHGQSPHASQMDYTIMANDILEFTESRQLDKVIIIGHSMGGKVAMMFANKYPQKLSKLIVVDIAPRAYKASHQIYFDAFREINLKSNSRKEIENQLETKIKSKDEILFLLKNIYRKDNGEFGLKLNLDAIENNYSNIIGAINIGSELTSIETPTLFIKGQNSNYISEKDILDFEKQFKLVKVVEIKNSGHWVHADNADDFFDEVSKNIATF